MAEDNYKATSILLEQGLWRSAISRAYYAVYSYVTDKLVKAHVTMPAGRENPSHARLPDLIIVKLAAMGMNRWRMCGLVRMLYLLRINADYKASRKVGIADAMHAARAMAEVFQLK